MRCNTRNLARSERHFSVGKNVVQVHDRWRRGPLRAQTSAVCEIIAQWVTGSARHGVLVTERVARNVEVLIGTLLQASEVLPLIITVPLWALLFSMGPPGPSIGPLWALP